MKYKLINLRSNEEHLCEKVEIDGFEYYVSNEKIHFGYVWNTILEQIETMFKEKTFHDDLKGIIATNNPNIDVPKVVDEVDGLADLEEAKEYSEVDPFDPCGYSGTDFNLGFQRGYNKSQESCPFSEEDMIEFADWMQQYQDLSCALRINEVESTKELLQLWKKQKTKTVYYE